MEPSFFTAKLFQKILLKRITNKGLDKGVEIGKRIFSDDFAKRLNQVISRTIKSYDKTYPIPDKTGKYAFYKSEILTEKLSEYILFDFPIDEKAILLELENNSKIIKLNASQLDIFFSLFYKHVQADEKLENLYIDENFKRRIFEIKPYLQNIERKLEELDTGMKRLLEKEFNTESKKWLNKFYDDIKAFQPKSSLINLDFLEKEINVEERHSKQVQAEIYYLKGLAFGELQEIERCHQEYINAYELESSNLKYKKRIILYYAEKGHNEEAGKLLEEVLLEKQYDPVAWAAKCFLSEDLKNGLQEVPSIVLDGDRRIAFMITICNLIKGDSIHFLVDEYFRKDIEEVAYPKEITFENQGYWLTIANLLLSSVDRDSSYAHDKINPKIQQNPNLKKSIDLHEFILGYFEGTQKNKLILILTFRLTFSKYLLSGEKAKIDQLVSLFDKIDERRKQHVLPLISIPLLHTNQYTKVIELTKNKETEIPLILLPIRAFAHFQLEQYNEAKRNINIYIKKIPKIDKTTFSPILFQFDFYEDQINREKVYEDLVKEGKCQHKGQELLLKFACYLPFHSTEILIEILEKALEKNPKEDLYIKSLIAQGFLIVEQYKRAAYIFKSFVDVSQYSPALEKYIYSLLKANSDSVKLLELLKDWRKQNYSIEQDFLLKELELLKEIRDWAQIEEVARVGVDHFLENRYFLFTLVLSLHKQKKTTIFTKIMSSIIDQHELPLDITFELAKIATYQGDIELALELCYAYASNQENKTARSFYFYQFSPHLDLTPSKIIEKVEVDCYVQLKANEATELKLVNEVSKQYDPIVKSVYGKKIGDVVQITKSFMQGIEQVEIIAIFDKYEGLLKEIMREQANEKINVKQVRIEGDKLETLNKQLVTLFGAEGSILKEVEKKLYNDYIIGNKSFSNLVKNKGHNPISVYYNLTSSPRKGLTVYPLSVFKNFTLKNNTEFVLDSTSLLLFFHLSESLGLAFQQKFWISKILIELIEQELYKTQSGKEITLALQITIEGVIPYFLPEGNRASNIQFLKKLLNWIDDNCRTKLVKEKLDTVAKLREKGGDVNDYIDSVIDTIFLASLPNTVLISDDFFYVKILLPKQTQISTEFFLRKKFAATYNTNIIPLLIQLNYKEIQVPKEFVFAQLNKHLNGEKSFFYSCLENLSLINQKNDMVEQVVEMTRKVYYYDNLLQGRKSILTQQIFAKSLKGVTRTSKNREFIQKSIWNFFRFTPSTFNEVTRDFDIVWKQYN